MLIDKFLPRWDVHAAYSILIRGTPEEVYNALQSLNPTSSLLVRLLVFLRSLPAPRRRREKDRASTALERFLKNGFILLDEKPGEEIVLGIVGKFWTTSGCLEQINPAEFIAFNKEAYAKAVWNFHLTQQSAGFTHLSTETRVACTDDAARKKFRRYWLLVKPFSGLIRRQMLRTIKRRVER